MVSLQDVGCSSFAAGTAAAGILLSAVRHCPAAPGVMEEKLIYHRSTHHSFLLSSHCFPAVPSDCAGTATLGKIRDGTRQEKSWGSVDPSS